MLSIDICVWCHLTLRIFYRCVPDRPEPALNKWLLSTKWMEKRQQAPIPMPQFWCGCFAQSVFVFLYFSGYVCIVWIHHGYQDRVLWYL